jgi:hypothetical protein
MRAAPCSLKGAPGLRGVTVVVRDDATAEPPAHCRLVSGHDPKRRVAYKIVPLEIDDDFDLLTK